MTIELDGRRMTDRAAAHDYLKEQLDLPDRYGRNLDALYDLLTERGQPLRLVVRHQAEMSDHLGHYAAALLDTLRDAAEHNPALDVLVE